MNDIEIVDLYWSRDEKAIKYTDEKYGNYCRKIALNILYSREDSEECVNDTYLKAWNSMPPHRPEKLSTFIGKICRNHAINLYEKLTAIKRGSGQIDACLDELGEIVSDNSSVEDNLNLKLLTETINAFLAVLPVETRRIFVKRYWYMLSVKDIAKELEISESKVKMTLLRTRKKMKECLMQEGYEL